VGRGKKIVDIELVVDEAVALIEEGGVEEFSTRRLASRLGISAMTLYNYYENRGAIVRGALKRGFALLWEGLSDEVETWRAAGGSSLGAYRVLADHLIAFAVARPRLCRFILTEGASDDWSSPDGYIERICGAGLGERSEALKRDIYLFELVVFSLALKVIIAGETIESFRELMTEGYDRLIRGYETPVLAAAQSST
jgi:AcrR family transcriptional regulator